MADERDRAAPRDESGDLLDDALVLDAPQTRRPHKTEAERAQGLKTRTAFKDIVSRRM